MVARPLPEFMDRSSLDRSCFLAIFLGAWIFVGLYALFALTRNGTTAYFFLAVPFVTGSVVSLTVNFREQIFKSTLLSLFVNGLITLVFLPEGTVCLLMASPIILIMTLFGAWGCSLTRYGGDPKKPRKLLSLLLGGILVFSAADSYLMASRSEQITQTEFVLDGSRDEIWARLSFDRQPRAPMPGWLDWWMHAPEKYAFGGEGLNAQRYVDFGPAQAGDDEDRPRGKIIFMVTRWEPGQSVEFTCSDNQTRLDKWIDLGVTRVELIDEKTVEVAGAKTRVRLTTQWRRKLGPGFYFTPFLRAGVAEAHQVLAAELREQP